MFIFRKRPGSWKYDTKSECLTQEHSTNLLVALLLMTVLCLHDFRQTTEVLGMVQIFRSCHYDNGVAKR